jgi:hypothetical protein
MCHPKRQLPFTGQPRADAQPLSSTRWTADGSACNAAAFRKGLSEVGFVESSSGNETAQSFVLFSLTSAIHFAPADC